MRCPPASSGYNILLQQKKNNRDVGETYVYIYMSNVAVASTTRKTLKHIQHVAMSHPHLIPGDPADRFGAFCMLAANATEAIGRSPGLPQQLSCRLLWSEAPQLGTKGQMHQQTPHLKKKLLVTRASLLERRIQERDMSRVENVPPCSTHVLGIGLSVWQLRRD